MFAKSIWIFGFVALLSACGGGGGDDAPPATLYGSIAVNASKVSTGIAAGYTKQADADMWAIQNCELSGCQVVKQFTGPGNCAVTAWSVGGVVSYGVAATKSDAETQAMINCKAGGGAYCELSKFLCM